MWTDHEAATPLFVFNFVQITHIASSHTYVKAWSKKVLSRCEVIQTLPRRSLFSENRNVFMVLTCILFYLRPLERYGLP